MHVLRVHAVGRAAAALERVQNFVLVLEDFTTENGMLTPTLKVKRRVVLERYGQELDGLY